LITVDHTTASFRTASLLACFGSMYFAVTTMTREEYRREFFERVIGDVERALTVRAVYLGLRPAQASGAPRRTDHHFRGPDMVRRWGAPR
jgi:hypothetical protein